MPHTRASGSSAFSWDTARSAVSLRLAHSTTSAPQAERRLRFSSSCKIWAPFSAACGGRVKVNTAVAAPCPCAQARAADNTARWPRCTPSK